jgi:hypothetical protein
MGNPRAVGFYIMPLIRYQVRERDAVSPAFQATFWGFVSGGALVLGAAMDYLVQAPNRVTVGVMVVGNWVLIFALSFELLREAFKGAGLAAALIERNWAISFGCLYMAYFPSCSAK